MGVSQSGNYEDFYDGYIFLLPLKDEPYDYELPELYTDNISREGVSMLGINLE
jgi:hypothetical protein